jgi:hypothetical protein
VGVQIPPPTLRNGPRVDDPGAPSLQAGRLAADTYGGRVLVVRRWGKWRENAELVSFRIGEHDPAHVPLPDLRTSRAEGEDALDLSLLILRAEVEVESILDDLAIRNLHEQDVRRDVNLAAPSGGSMAYSPSLSKVIRHPRASDQKRARRSQSAESTTTHWILMSTSQRYRVSGSASCTGGRRRSWRFCRAVAQGNMLVLPSD